MYKHILIASGGAEHSQRAEERAVEMSLAVDAKLSLITVLRNDANSDIPKESRIRIQESILKKAAERCQRHGVMPETYMRQGNAGKRIIETAKELDCDVIVLGNRQLSLIGVMTEGSVSDYVIRHTHTDVLTVI